MYIVPKVTGALLASLFVKTVIGAEANLGANSPNYSSSALGVRCGCAGFGPAADGYDIGGSAQKSLRGFGGMATGEWCALTSSIWAWAFSFMSPYFVGPCIDV